MVQKGLEMKDIAVTITPFSLEKRKKLNVYRIGCFSIVLISVSYLCSVLIGEASQFR